MVEWISGVGLNLFRKGKKNGGVLRGSRLAVQNSSMFNWKVETKVGTALFSDQSSEVKNESSYDFWLDCHGKTGTFFGFWSGCKSERGVRKHCIISFI